MIKIGDYIREPLLGNDAGQVIAISYKNALPNYITVVWGNGEVTTELYSELMSFFLEDKNVP